MKSLNKAPSEIKFQGESWKLIGKVKNPHGLKGDFLLHLFSKNAQEWASDLKKVLFVGTKEKILNVERVKTNGTAMVLSLKEIKDRTEADKYLKPVVYAPAELFVADEGETLFLGEIKNFKVVDGKEKAVGVITGFDSNGPQDLLIVRMPNGQETLIPLVEAFLEKIDYQKKTVFMNLPEGLTEVGLVEAKNPNEPLKAEQLEEEFEDDDFDDDDDLDEED